MYRLAVEAVERLHEDAAPGVAHLARGVRRVLHPDVRAPGGPGRPRLGPRGDCGDVAAAKSQLQQCGKPGGFSTTIAIRTDETKEPQVATALQASLANSTAPWKI